MPYQTIRQAAQNIGLPEFCVRSLVRRGECPGFYQGSRFYVNVPLLREQLEATSRANMTARSAEATP